MAMLFSSPLHSLGIRDVENFCRIWPEGVRVEYKRELVASARHIPKIVSSFANTSGGILILGVVTNPENLPIFPIRGFPRERGIEERITQTCYQNIYPPLFPEIKIIDVTEPGENVVAVVQVLESAEAPHAIENSTKVYIRTNSTTEIIQLAEIDRIEYFLKRRQQPEQKREEMIHDMGSRMPLGPPCLKVVVSPRYPSRPIFGADLLGSRLQTFSQPGTYSSLPCSIRLVRQGFMSMPTAAPDYHFEVNLHGVIFCCVPLDVNDERVFLTPIVNGIGSAFDLARYLLKDTSGNYFVRVYLDGVQNRLLMIPPPQKELRSIENTVQAESSFALENLNDPLFFQDSVAELVRQIAWSFNWGDKTKIFENTRQILQRSRLPHQGS